MPNQSAWRLNETVMNESHLTYLNLGSNIQPETNLLKAVKLLSEYGEIQKISNVWESKSVGANGPNYLNACILFKTDFAKADLKKQVIRPVEAKLGRKRGENKYAPRTMDIDIVLFDDTPVNNNYWETAFVIIPLADLYPDFKNPITNEKVIETAARLSQKVWLERRQIILG